jgi:hypothetical protein
MATNLKFFVKKTAAYPVLSPVREAHTVYPAPAIGLTVVNAPRPKPIMIKLLKWD